MYERYYCVNDLPKRGSSAPQLPMPGIGRVVLSRWFIIKSQNRDAANAKQWDAQFFVRSSCSEGAGRVISATPCSDGE